MQPARIKLHAKEHTNNPVQRPNFRGHALTFLALGARNKKGNPKRPSVPEVRESPAREDRTILRLQQKFYVSSKNTVWSYGAIY